MAVPQLIAPILLLMTFLGVFPLDVILPSVPAMAEHFEVSYRFITAGVGLFAVIVALAQLVIGPASDRFGRKPLFLGCLLIAMIGALGSAFASSNWAFQAWRVVQAIGCGGFVLVHALVQDLFTGAQRTRHRIGLSAASGVFISVSPLLGVVLQQHIGWQGSFYGFAAVALITGMLAAWALPARPPEPARGQSAEAQPVDLAGFIRASSLAMLAFASHFSFMVLSPVLFMHTLGLSPATYGLVMLLYGAAYLVGGVLASQVARRIDESRQMRLGLKLIFMAGLGLGAVQAIAGAGAASVILAACVMTCGVTLLRPAATTLAMNALPGRAGIAAAGLNTITLVGGGLISVGLSLGADYAAWLLPAALLAMSAAGLGACALPATPAGAVTAPAPE